MKLLKFIPLQLSLALIFGLLSGCYLQFNVLFSTALILAIFFAFSLVYFLHRSWNQRSPIFAYSSLLLFYSFGLTTTTLQHPQNNQSHYLHLIAKTNDQPLLVLRITKSLRSTEKAHRYVAELEQIDTTKSIGNILVSISRNSNDRVLQIGQKIITKEQLSKINPPKNPYQFNYQKYLEQRGIFKQIFLQRQKYFLIKGESKSLLVWAEKFRKKATESLKKSGFEATEIAMLNALLLGQRTDLPDQIIRNYTNAGAIHILAISGLHIGILLAILRFLLMPLNRFKKGRSFSLLLSLLLLWSYAIVAGLSPSIVRAVTMFSAVALSIFGRRSSNMYHNLIISVFLLLMMRPSYLYEIGFQLSYLAVFAIVLIQPIFEKLWQPPWFVARYFWQLFTVSLAAQIGVLPLSLFYFHQFPSLFFLSNLVVIPVLGMLLLLGGCVIFLALVGQVPSIIVHSFSKLIEFLNIFIAWVASQEALLFRNISFTKLQMLLSYLSLAFLLYWLYRKSTAHLKAFLVGLFLLQVVFLYEKWEGQTNDEWVVFNQAKASLITRKQGRNLIAYHTLDSLQINDTSLSNYITGAKTKWPITENSLPRNELFAHNLLLIDSLGLYPKKAAKRSVVILVQSPKINLDRMIELVEPVKIIADNSNYTSYVHRWKRSCAHLGIPFHYTNEAGAWISSE